MTEGRERDKASPEARARLTPLLDVSSNTQHTLKLRTVQGTQVEENGPQLNFLCSKDGRESLFMSEQSHSGALLPFLLKVVYPIS